MKDIDRKLEFLRDKMKNPPGISGQNQERKIREQKKMWKKESSKLQRRTSREDLKDWM